MPLEWTKEMDATIRANWGTLKPGEIADLLGVHATAVGRAAVRMGLAKTKRKMSKSQADVEVETEAAPEAKFDAECAAMGWCVEHMEPLSKDARRRVVLYLAERYGVSADLNSEN